MWLWMPEKYKIIFLFIFIEYYLKKIFPDYCLKLTISL